ncbi:MAG: U32 family peptidase [Candidatus Omnitrophica bacterium]|nr:U32 family peptidase [Candidatus Omnitrophota bacterium]
MKTKPELLAPAGDWGALYSAIENGADSVYFGIKGINMRHAAGNFDILEIKKVMDILHEKGRKGYLALNVLVYDSERDKIKNILDMAKKAKVDAVILWDMAVLTLAKERDLEIHLSTQASVSNFEALKAYSELGVKRIVLARECDLKSIQDIVRRIGDENIDCGVETFIHGAMCVSISGRCFLSHDSFSKSANRGECLQPCRREFTIKDKDDECEYILGEDYVLSPRDLCTVGFIDQLIESGIEAFKIEGRMRSPEYVARVTASYRKAIDAYFDGSLNDALKEDLLSDLRKSFNRGFAEGFFFGRPDDLGSTPQGEYKKTYLGEVIKFYKKIGVAEIIVNTTGLKKGQKILITGKKTPAAFTEVIDMEIEHEAVESVERGEKVGIKLPFEVRKKDKVFLWEDK